MKTPQSKMSIKNTINLEVLYQNELSSDVHFVLRNKSDGNFREIPAHKAILASRSPVFERMFWGDHNLNEGALVRISDVSADAFNEFLQFFYFAELDLTSSNIAEVLKLIDKYDVSGCFSLCEAFLERTVTVDLVYLYYELTLSFDMSPKIVNQFENIICKAPQHAFHSGPVGGSSRFVLQNILESGKLKCDEIDIFNGAVSWACVSLTNKGESITTAAIRNELGECLYAIRFPIMTVAQFMGCLERWPNLLEPDEYFDILCFIVNKKALKDYNKFSAVRRDKTKHIDVWFSVVHNFEVITCHTDTALSFRVERAGHALALVGFKIPKMLPDTLCVVRLYENEQLKLNETVTLVTEDYCDPEVQLFSCQLPRPFAVDSRSVYRLDVNLEQPAFRSFSIPTTVCKGNAQFDFRESPYTYISQLNFEEIL